MTLGQTGHISDDSARLRAAVDPEGQGPVTDCTFDYVTQSTFKSSGYQAAAHAPCDPAPGSGSGDVAVHADITSLTSATEYRFRLRATNASGASLAEGSFTTLSSPPHIKDLESFPATARTNTSARLRGTLDPNGVPVTDCHFDWGTSTTYGQTIPCSPDPGSGSGEVAVHADLSTLQPNTTYHFRLQATNAAGTTLGADEAFLTRGPPLVETTGTSLRTATTARLLGRIDPRDAATSYHFEWSTDDSYANTTPALPAGEGLGWKLVSAQILGLTPGTTYNYRLVADNGNPDGAAIGQGAAVTTRPNDEPLDHGPYAGPPGSDRAWELVSLPDSSGNAVLAALSIADSGDRALYEVAGGTTISANGTLYNQLLSERTETAPHQGSWQSSDALPPRSTWTGNQLLPPMTNSDLSVRTFFNNNLNTGAMRLIRVGGGPAATLLELVDNELFGRFHNWFTSDDGSRTLAAVKGSYDPTHPSPADRTQIYDISSGPAQLASLLPGPGAGTVPACGVDISQIASFSSPSSLTHWISSDGSLFFFPSRGGSCSDPAQLYVRDLGAATTAKLTPAPLSGPTCDERFVRSTADAAFFVTAARLDSDDIAPASCTVAADDIYRYRLNDGSLDCLTCVAEGIEAELSGTAIVSDDGSRLYFSATNPLLPGAPTEGLYRLEIAGGQLAYVAPRPPQSSVFPEDDPTLSSAALTPDGSVLAFHSADPRLDTVAGGTNAGTRQYYIYDDRDRSLVCASCPQDGSAPLSAVPPKLVLSELSAAPGRNLTPLDRAGDFFFSTDTPLVPADQNTAGPGQPSGVGEDIYEWRDGRLLLVSDGATPRIAGPQGPSAPTRVGGVSPSGRDVFFIQAAKLTPDAIDSYPRVYDARLGGGFDFPPPPPPCSLEDCQGPPSPSPIDPDILLGSGPGNQGKDRTHPSTSAKKKCKTRKKKKKSKKGGCRKKTKHHKHKKRKHHRNRSHR